MNLAEISKLPLAMQKAAMADQARSTAARERIMSQVKINPEWRALESSGKPYAEIQQNGSWRSVAAKSPRKPVSVAGQAIPTNFSNATHSKTPRPKPESPVLDESLWPPQREGQNPRRFRICITSVRKRLIDPDNLCGKYFIDCCRYAGLIHSDAPQFIEVTTTQRKPVEGEEEHTLIDILPL